MPGGYKNIKHEDGTPFEKDNKAAEKWTEEIALKFGNDLLNWIKESDENIFYDEFIFLVAKDSDYHPKIKIYPDLIEYLTKKYSTFCELIKKAEKLQEIKLKKFGCFDKLNASMVKFTLINNHGWADATRTELTGKNGKDLIPQPLTKEEIEMRKQELKRFTEEIEEM